MFSYIKAYFERKTKDRMRHVLQPGKTVSRFIAKDVKRVVLVVSADEFDAGYITAQVRTTNVLYRVNNLVREQDFGPPERIPLADLWHWTGKSWGGLADGTSIVDHSAKPDTCPQDGG